MKKNIGKTDRIIRILIALIAGYLAIRGNFEQNWIPTLLWIVSAVALLTALVNRCGLYCLFGISTCKVKKSR